VLYCNSFAYFPHWILPCHALLEATSGSSNSTKMNLAYKDRH